MGDGLEPLTEIFPAEMDVEYPVTGVTLYAYVPFISVNPIVEVVEEFVAVPSVTDQVVPAVRPDSVNVIG
jgi:hypothetical protein